MVCRLRLFLLISRPQNPLGERVLVLTAPARLSSMLPRGGVSLRRRAAHLRFSWRSAGAFGTGSTEYSKKRLEAVAIPADPDYIAGF